MYMLAHPPKGSSDPIDHWKKKPEDTRADPTRSQDCEFCGAQISVIARPSGLGEVSSGLFEVKVRRPLGAGKSENDPAWLAQCGL